MGTIQHLFHEYEKKVRNESFLDMPIPSPEEVNAHQKAEVEVLDYLRDKKLDVMDDPFAYWSGNNAVKWPLLTKLAHRYFSAPATSAESER